MSAAKLLITVALVQGTQHLRSVQGYSRPILDNGGSFLLFMKGILSILAEHSGKYVVDNPP